MAIDTKKILGDTSEEWHERTGTNPSEYIGEGVHADYTATTTDDCIENFAKIVPADSEVVVNYRVSTSKYHIIVSGTALIPKIKN